MKELLIEIKAVEEFEYLRASHKHGPTNNSAHESYAIIREEFEEAKEEEKEFESFFNMFWYNVKTDSHDLKIFFSDMREHAERAAAEWVQVAAMCQKAAITDEEGKR